MRFARCKIVQNNYFAFVQNTEISKFPLTTEENYDKLIILGA